MRLDFFIFFTYLSYIGIFSHVFGSISYTIKWESLKLISFVGIHMKGTFMHFYFGSSETQNCLYFIFYVPMRRSIWFWVFFAFPQPTISAIMGDREMIFLKINAYHQLIGVGNSF